MGRNNRKSFLIKSPHFHWNIPSLYLCMPVYSTILPLRFHVGSFETSYSLRKRFSSLERFFLEPWRPCWHTAQGVHDDLFGLGLPDRLRLRRCDHSIADVRLGRRRCSPILESSFTNLVHGFVLMTARRNWTVQWRSWKSSDPRRRYRHWSHIVHLRMRRPGSA